VLGIVVRSLGVRLEEALISLVVSGSRSSQLAASAPPFTAAPRSSNRPPYLLLR
jgi:hypothetical protein